MVESLVTANSPMIDSKERFSRRDSLIQNARSYIHDHLQENISLDDISRIFNISKYHFVRLFKKHTGRTPYQYMLDYKINAARKDLEAGVELFEVMSRYGFYDMSHFNKRFKEVYGVTPYEYQSYVIF